MYVQKRLQPAFDIYEFVRSYEKRKIDIEKEGYNEIAEAIEYFQKLEIDKSLAEYITTIDQDGGNNIYMNIIPFWSGEDEVFDIRSYDDIKHFPNLKRIRVFSIVNPKTSEELRLNGVDIKSI